MKTIFYIREIKPDVLWFLGFYGQEKSAGQKTKRPMLLKVGNFDLNLPSDDEDIRCKAHTAYSLPLPDEVKQLQRFFGRPIPDSMRKFYAEVGGLVIETQIDNHQVNVVSGQAHLVNASQMFELVNDDLPTKRKFDGWLWDQDEVGHRAIADLEEDYHLFDVVSLRYRTVVLLRLTERNPVLFLYKFPFRMYELKLTFDEYIENCLTYKAQYGWQEQFIHRERLLTREIVFMNWERSLNFFGNEINPNNVLPVSEENERIQKCITHYKWRERLVRRTRLLRKHIGMEGILYWNGESSDEELPVPFWKALDPTSVQLVENDLGKRLPDEVIAFYSQLNGCSMSWTILNTYNSGIVPRASFVMPDFHKAFQLDDILAAKQEQPDFFSRFIGFTHESVYNREPSSFEDGCRLIFKSEKTRVYMQVDEPGFPLYLKLGSGYFKLKVDFKGFIEELVSCMGVDFFAHTLCADLPSDSLEFRLDESFKNHLEKLMLSLEKE